MKLILLIISVTSVVASGTGGQGFSGSFSTGNGQGYSYGGSFGGPTGSSGSGGSGVSGGYGGGFGGSGGSGGFGGNFGPGGSTGFGGSFGTGNSGGHGHGESFGGDNFIPHGIPQFDFNSLISDYFETFKKFNQGLANTLQNQQNVFGAGGYGFPGGYPAYSGGGFGGGFSNLGGQGASASASIGPGGAHQTAGVYPQNPNIPNVDTRFGTPTGGGSYGVFTSSHSVSSNVNGKPTTYQQASTTINDNGKITKYTVHNP